MIFLLLWNSMCENKKHSHCIWHDSNIYVEHLCALRYDAICRYVCFHLFYHGAPHRWHFSSFQFQTHTRERARTHTHPLCLMQFLSSLFVHCSTIITTHSFVWFVFLYLLFFLLTIIIMEFFLHNYGWTFFRRFWCICFGFGISYVLYTHIICRPINTICWRMLFWNV